jgi:hypothetical protein
MTINVTAFFCEDVREEKSGTLSIVGILPDNVSVASVPGMLPKIGIYLRIHFDPENAPEDIVVNISEPSGEEYPMARFEPEIIADAVRNAKRFELPYAGLLFHAVAPAFQVRATGLISLKVQIDGQEHIAGAMNVHIEQPDAHASR